MKNSEQINEYLKQYRIDNRDMLLSKMKEREERVVRETLEYFGIESCSPTEEIFYCEQCRLTYPLREMRVCTCYICKKENKKHGKIVNYFKNEEKK